MLGCNECGQRMLTRGWRWEDGGWQVSSAAVDRREARSLARLEGERRRQERERALVARKERAHVQREHRRLLRQQEVIERQHRKVALETRRERENQQALAGGNYAWLLADQRRATQQVRNQMAAVQRKARPGALTEPRWRQAQEAHQLAERHQTELVALAQDQGQVPDPHLGGRAPIRRITTRRGCSCVFVPSQSGCGGGLSVVEYHVP